MPMMIQNWQEIIKKHISNLGFRISVPLKKYAKSLHYSSHVFSASVKLFITVQVK